MQPTRLIAVALLLLFAGSTVAAQTATGENLTIYAGFSFFPDPDYDSLVLIEVPFSLTRSEFEFFRPNEIDNFLSARVFAQLDLIGSNGLPIDSVSTYFSVQVADADQARAKGVRLFNKLRLFARPGVYSARVTVIDAVSKRSGSAFLDRVIVEPPVRNRISLGGPILAYHAAAVTDTTAVNMRLVKNGFLILPNPVGVFAVRDTAMYCYGEVYNAPAVQQAHGDGSNCRLTFELLDGNDSLLRVIGTRPSLPVGATVAFAERFDIGGWLPAPYQLRIIADDPARAAADTQVVRFAVVSPADLLAVRDKSVPGDPYAQLPLDQRVALAWFFLNPEQQNILQRLSAEGKETFLAQYWAEHDRDPSTSINEGRVELVARLLHVNNRFSLSETKDDGWRSDRGRIYLTYGQPDKMDDRVVPLSDQPGGGADNTGRPYQIWYYRSVGEGKVFVFIDDRGNNEYRLVHSNVYGEVYSKNWANMLLQGFPDWERDM